MSPPFSLVFEFPDSDTCWAHSADRRICVGIIVFSLLPSEMNIAQFHRKNNLRFVLAPLSKGQFEEVSKRIGHRKIKNSLVRCFGWPGAERIHHAT